MHTATGLYHTPRWQKMFLGVTTILAMAAFTAGFLVTYPQIAHAATTIFSDGFETGDFSAWTSDNGVWDVETGGTHSGLKKAEAKGDTGSSDDVLRKAIPTIGQENVTLKYWYKIAAGLESGDHIRVEWTIDGSTWNPLEDYSDINTSNNYVEATHVLPLTASNQSGFQFRFRAKLSSNSDQFWLDDVLLTGDAIPTTATLTLEKTVVTNNGGTAVDTDWTLSATNGGDTTISGVEGDLEITDAEVPVGTYDLSESDGPLVGYSASDWVCTDGVMVDGNTVTLSDGNDAVCTITNDDQPGTLIVVKELPNDDGSTANPEDFSFQVNGGDSTAFEEDGQNNITVNAGTYTVTEDGVPLAGYDTTYDNCEDVVVGNGETETCTITNDDIAPSLTVIKVIENDGPTRVGTKNDPSDFSFFVDLTEVFHNIVEFFEAGSYTVFEENADGYNATFSGDCASDGSITLELGGEYTCTITNNDKEPGILHVFKQVINDEPEGFEGTAEEDDFTLTVSGGNPDPASFSGSELGVPVIIDAGASYSVSETAGPSGYGVSYSAGCSGEMPEGGEATCTITNDDLPPTQGSLTVLKSVISDNGGDAPASAWTLLVTDSEDTTTAVVNGEANLLNHGTYTLDETGGVDGYKQTGISCTDNGLAAGGSPITVVEGHSYVCTIVNDDTAPSLTVVKEVLNDNGGSAEASEWTVGAIGPTSISGAGSALSDGTFEAGTYELTEIGGPSSGYTAGDWSCTNGVAVNNESGENEITLGIGEETTCTIVNDDEPATLIVIKHVINDNGGEAFAEDFTIYVEGGDASPSEFSGDEEGTEVTLDAGSYSVSEDGPDGYGLTASEECSGTIENGETKTCTLTNDDGKATLTIEKSTFGADGTFVFTVTDQEDVEITTSERDGSADLALDASIYDVIELVPAGWTLVVSYCEYDEEETGEQIENGHTVFLDVGDHVTCYFEDTATGADVSVEKSVDDDTPDAGQTILYTITVSNAGPADAENVTVFDSLPSGVTYVSDDGEGDYSSETGEWNVGGLPNGEPRTLTITVTVDSGTEGQVIENGATVSVSDEEVSDYDDSNNEGTTSITVNTPEPEIPAPTPPPGGGGGGGIPSLFGVVNFGGGAVLGVSTGGQVLGESCGLYLGQYLRRGNPKNSADQVTKLQEFLVENGFGVFSPTGFFGPLTEGAVRAFQNQYASSILAPWGLSTPTGLAYLTTIRQLNLLECPDLSIEVPELVPWSQNPNVQ